MTSPYRHNARPPAPPHPPQDDDDFEKELRAMGVDPKRQKRFDTMAKWLGVVMAIVLLVVWAFIRVQFDRWYVKELLK